MDILKGLNENQVKAVTHLENPLLVLSGAGSGKTKTIITRLAYLIEYIGIPSSSTLTITFTNKAAYEMQSRALEFLSPSSTPPLLCTFHKLGLLFLKFHMQYLNRNSDFLLLDSDDRKKIMKIIFKNLKFKTSKITPSSTLEFISRMKNTMLSPKDIESSNENEYENIRMYKEYENYLLANNLVDFDDLLFLPYKILLFNPSLAASISSKYNYIMVDEYQDTNDLQYEFLKLLCTSHNNICVVGDDDQSIYGFRGANINNILSFNKFFPNTTIIKLEKNYRSSDEILDAANKLISNNTERLGKNLQGVRGKKGDVELTQCNDEVHEASLVTKKIKTLLQNGESPKEIAILFRINLLSISIEIELIKAKIPYKIVGALRFYERAEIKDIISYFRASLNLDDNLSILRIINKPKRGIGKISLNKLENISLHSSLYNAFINNQIPLPPSQLESIKKLFDILINLKKLASKSIEDFLEYFEKKVDILSSYDELSISSREENICEFYGYLRDYMNNNPSSSLSSFLEEITLNTTNDEYNFESYVSCMSVHSSKGLEFKHVFIIGFENNLFPIEQVSLQEERRVAYVAFTRAKDNLYISYAASRLLRGKKNKFKKSIFLEESGLIFESNTKATTKSEIKVNDLVFHKMLGTGRVVKIKEDSLEIDFGGIKRNIKSSFVEKI